MSVWKICLENIQKVSAEYYKIKVADLLSKRRSRSIARPRQVAMALAKELTNHSLPETCPCKRMKKSSTTIFQKCSGMTLLELVVAIAVFSLVAAAAYAALSQGLVIQERLQEQRRFWQRFETVFNLIHSDLEQAVDRAPRTTTTIDPAFIGHEHGNAAQYGYLLEFTRGGHTEFHEGPASPFLRIAYRLRDGGLYRRVWARLDRPYGAEPLETLLLDGIDEVRLRYLAGAGEWAMRWPGYEGSVPGLFRHADDGALEQAESYLPRTVEMKVKLDDHGFYKWLFHVGPPR